MFYDAKYVYTWAGTHTHSEAFTPRQSKKQTNEAFLKQTTWLRLKRGENQVWTPSVMKSCVNVCQGCVFKDAVCVLLRDAPPPEGDCLGMLSPTLLLTTCWSSSGRTYRQESRAWVSLWETHFCFPWSCICSVFTDQFSSFPCSLL